MTCSTCERIKNSRAVLYSSDRVVVFVPDSPATLGHLEVVPRKHAPLLEQLDAETSAELFVVANKVSIGLFEALGVRGTNLLVKNGLGAGQTVPHCSLHVLARTPDDAINLKWTPQEIVQEELEQLKTQLLAVPSEPSPEPNEAVNSSPEETPAYYIQALRRLP